MSNSELIDCTRETEKLRMREIERRSGGDEGSRRQRKKGHRLQAGWVGGVGGGCGSDGRKMEGGNVRVREVLRWERNGVVVALQSLVSSVRVVARLFLVPILKIVVQLWPQEWQQYQVRHKEGESPVGR